MGEIFVAAVDQRENARIATVGNLQKHGAISPISILRAHGGEVGGEFDFTIFQVHCVAQIHNAPVVHTGYRQREEDTSSDAFVGSGSPKFFSVEDSGTCGYVDVKNPRVEREHSQSQ